MADWKAVQTREGMIRQMDGEIVYSDLWNTGLFTVIKFHADLLSGSNSLYFLLDISFYFH